MKYPVRSFLKFLFFILIIVVAWNFTLVRYGFNQLNGQLKLVFNAVPVATALNDSTLNHKEIEKLLLIENIRKYAFDSLGMTESDNYTTFYNQHDKPVMWVVTGCKLFNLEAKTWWFPFIGNVSYKGFFKEYKAKIEADKIKKEGYETNIYSPSAWSTLGFLNDPILSNFLKRSSGSIAELIFHELTHGTVYLKSSVDFNENFATFIGERGAEKFLAFHFGNNSTELHNYKAIISDDEIFGNYMLSSAHRLDSLYKSFKPELPYKQKVLLKYKTIAHIMLGINQLPLNFPNRYHVNFKKDGLPNNTEFMAFLRYRKKQEIFKKVFAEIYHGDLKLFITDITEKAKDKVALPFTLE